jgi:predicted  nucleic acid-binding Zn-ribbon protein
MNNSISAEKTNLSQLEKKSRELQMKMEALLNVEADVAKACQQLELNEAALKKKSEVLSNIQTEQESIDAQQTTMNDLTIREQQLLRQLAAAQDKLSRLQTQQEQRRQQIGQRLKTLQEEYTIVAEERARVMAKVEQSDKVIKDFEFKMADLRRTHEAEMVNLRADCLSLKSQVLVYSNEVKKSL